MLNEENDCSSFLILNRIVVVHVGRVFSLAWTTLHSQCRDHIGEIFGAFFILNLVFELLLRLFLLIDEYDLWCVNEVLVDHLLVG
jgi:hypothetical protein